MGSEDSGHQNHRIDILQEYYAEPWNNQLMGLILVFSSRSDMTCGE